MFAGHVGAGLILARAERRVNLGAFIAAALFLDLVLWLFVLLGWESVFIPAGFASAHQVDFVFPYSHSLLAGLAWSVLAGAAVVVGYPRLRAAKWRAAAFVAVAVFSHWPLDLLVHRAEMPLAGAGSRKLGFGLWQSMPSALAVEAAIVVVGLLALLPVSGLARVKALALTLFTGLILLLTIAGMTLAPPPPSAAAMAGSSLVTVGATCLLMGWLGAKRVDTRSFLPTNSRGQVKRRDPSNTQR